LAAEELRVFFGAAYIILELEGVRACAHPG
jgi:hypothetical protein